MDWQVGSRRLWMSWMVVMLLTFIPRCSEKVAERPAITASQQQQIEVFAEKLAESINNYDLQMITRSWDDEAFKSRVRDLTKTQQSVFDHYFEKDIRKTIKFGNLAIVHEVNDQNGQVKLLKVEHFTHYSEVILFLTFEGRFNFFKYRVEITGGQPALTDFYEYMSNSWYSEKIIELLRLNSKFDAFSDERQQANMGILSSDQLLRAGDTLNALYALYEVPETHEVGNSLSLRRLDLASALPDSIYATVLVTEYETNPSLYMKYLYSFHFGDSAKLDAVYEVLSKELGESVVLDSLIQNGSLWY